MATVRVPPVLRSHTGGQRDVRAEGATVAEVLGDLTTTYPALKNQLLQDGSIQRYINVYVNNQDIQYLEKMQTPVADGDTVIILPAMAGGESRP